jgi:hypothetical protein
MTTSQQPFLHGPGHYDRMAAGPGAPDAASSQPPWDPQSVVEAPTLAARIEASGVIGTCEQERRDAYAAYLAMLGSSVAQLAASLLHGYFNKRSLVVAAGPDGPRFRIGGDRTLLTGGDGALHAFRANAVSRRAVSELLARRGRGVMFLCSWPAAAAGDTGPPRAHTTWMPHPRRWNSMNAASTS